jgi:hypothetical protein
MATQAWVAAVAGIGVAMWMVDSADAAPRKRGVERATSSVQACSNYGHGCTSAPVRRTSIGEEFRMPGGTWVSCRLDCKTALREEVLDFWETLRERGGDNYD